MLQVAFDAGLGFVLDEDRGAAQHVRVQFGLAGAVAADAIDVHAGLDQSGRQDRGVGLVGSHGGHYIRAAHRFGDARARDQAQRRVLQVAHQRGGGGAPARIVAGMAVSRVGVVVR